ncbi:MAG: glucose 1-dehydrogenase [Chloroflexi bacterium]|nr:glucose 1-dehydrogenase [Chloroflexota bacterium]
MRLEGKVALITGAAAGVQGEVMGFGGAAAWLFAGEGAKLVLTDILEEQGRRTESQLREQGYDAVFTKLDVTSESDWEAAIKLTIDTYGKLDILVNNAGTGGRMLLMETTEEAWDAQMDVHAKGAFLGMKYAVPEMRKAGGGSIINVSSIYGLVGSRTSTAYHAAKGASRIISKSAAIQYAGEGIRVNSIHPGFCRTPMTNASYQDPEHYEPLLERIPMGRVGNPEELAQGMLYLASDESSYVTGAEIVIDGGVTAT